ncbi:NifU family protein [Patescibacteria group bacterium]
MTGVAKIKKVLEKDIRPMLAIHSGSVDFISFKDGIVKIRLQGACKGCPFSKLTLKWGIEEVLKSKIPEVKSVESVD